MRYRVKGVDRLDDLMVSVEEEYVALQKNFRELTSKGKKVARQRLRKNSLALEKLLKEMRKMLKEVEFEPVNTAE